VLIIFLNLNVICCLIALFIDTSGNFIKTLCGPVFGTFWETYVLVFLCTVFFFLLFSGVHHDAMLMTHLQSKRSSAFPQAEWILMLADCMLAMDRPQLWLCTWLMAVTAVGLQENHGNQSAKSW